MKNKDVKGVIGLMMIFLAFWIFLSIMHGVFMGGSIVSIFIGMADYMIALFLVICLAIGGMWLIPN